MNFRLTNLKIILSILIGIIGGYITRIMFKPGHSSLYFIGFAIFFVLTYLFYSLIQKKK